jgi:hypothetical protein
MRTVKDIFGDLASYRVMCPACLAAPGQDCTNPNRQGKAIVQPWAHMRRVYAARDQQV